MVAYLQRRHYDAGRPAAARLPSARPARPGHRALPVSRASTPVDHPRAARPRLRVVCFVDDDAAEAGSCTKGNEEADDVVVEADARISARAQRCRRAVRAACRSTCLADFMRTGHITGLLLLVSESLIVVLTVIRRRAQIVDRSSAAAITTTAVGCRRRRCCARRTGRAARAPDVVTALVVGDRTADRRSAARSTLGRSFGIAPANRGVVARGPCSARPPSDLRGLSAHARRLPDRASGAAGTSRSCSIADSALILRALIEERVLGHDARVSDLLPARRLAPRAGRVLAPCARSAVHQPHGKPRNHETTKAQMKSLLAT